MENQKNQTKIGFFQENIINKHDLLEIFKIFVEILSFGFMLNIAGLIFNIPFSIISILSLGTIYWFFESKFILLMRKLFSKR